MAAHLDEVNQYIHVADHAVLTIAKPWSMSMWLKLTDNAGSSHQTLLALGKYGAVPSAVFILFEEDSVTSPNKLWLYMRDETPTGWIIKSSTTPGTDRDWMHLLITFGNDDTVTIYVNGVSVGSGTKAGFGAIDRADGLFVGTDNLLTADRFCGGSFAELFIADSAFDSDQRAAMAAGACPAHYPDILSAWLPLVDDSDEVMGDLTVTKYNSPTWVAHPGQVYYPKPTHRHGWQFGHQFAGAM